MKLDEAMKIINEYEVGHIENGLKQYGLLKPEYILEFLPHYIYSAKNNKDKVSTEDLILGLAVAREFAGQFLSDMYASTQVDVRKIADAYLVLYEYYVENEEEMPEAWYAERRIVSNAPKNLIEAHKAGKGVALDYYIRRQLKWDRHDKVELFDIRHNSDAWSQA